VTIGYKILTHDYRSPIQGGVPVWDGRDLPFTLPTVRLDTSEADCAAGWNYTSDLATALRISGFWPDGRPAACFVVEPSADAIERGDKRRCSQLTLIRRCSDDEIRAAIADFSKSRFGDLAARMIESQCAWFEALARPEYDLNRVQKELGRALAARALPWSLKQFADAWDARGAWDARDAWGAWGAWDAWGAWGAWDARDAWDAWDARDARDALIVEFVALKGWITLEASKLTTGLRDAYKHGLAIALPVAKDTLGWAMRAKDDHA
jgi:hypothetical protein